MPHNNFMRQILALFGAFLGICEHIKLFLYSIIFSLKCQQFSASSEKYFLDSLVLGESIRSSRIEGTQISQDDMYYINYIGTPRNVIQWIFAILFSVRTFKQRA